MPRVVVQIVVVVLIGVVQVEVQIGVVVLQIGVVELEVQIGVVGVVEVEVQIVVEEEYNPCGRKGILLGESRAVRLEYWIYVLCSVLR